MHPNILNHSLPTLPANRARFLERSGGWFLLLAALLVGGRGARAQDGFCMINGTTTGGAGGTVVTVTNGTDFNTQINVTGPRIIQVQGVISIGRVTTKANKTIIGLGTDATLNGNLNISDTTNVIVRNLRIFSGGGDGITVWNAQHVWVDHCTFFDCNDGSCDMSRGSQYVTVSWCKFHYPTQVDHQFTMIADGYNNTAAGTTNFGYYTLHHNWWFTGADQRMPASSYGRIHMYNNYFTCTNNYYCSNARNETEITIENSCYAGVNNPVTVSSGTSGKIRTGGNLYPGCTGTIHPGTDSVFAPPYAYTLDAVEDVPALVMAGAGAPGPDTMAIPPKVWDGGAADNNLLTANNWQLNEYPKVYDTLMFAGGIRLFPNNNFAAASEFPWLAFSNNAGAFVLGGNAIGLGIGISDQSPATQTVNLNLDFTYGAHHYPTNRYFDVSSPSGNLVLNGKLTGGTSNYVFSLIKQGDGTLVLNGVNTFVGSVQLDGGRLRFQTLDTNAPGSLAEGTDIGFNGGGLQWAANNSADISARTVTIHSRGATLDVGANVVTLAHRIGNGGAGALTKLGTGTLTFLATNNYRGDTIIAQGVLALGATGWLTNSPQIVLSNNAVLDVSARSDRTQTLLAGRTLAGNGTVRGSVLAASGSTVAPGLSIGTLVITNTLTFQADSTNLMELDAAAHTNDVITGLASVSYGGRLIVTNLGGTLAAGDRFRLFSADHYNSSFASVTLPLLTGNLSWTNQLAVDGTLGVVSVVNTTPTNLVCTVTNGVMVLSWPADHLGWRLEAQTNTLSVGLGANWVTVAGSAETNLLWLPISPTAESVFYRLTYP